MTAAYYSAPEDASDFKKTCGNLTLEWDGHDLVEITTKAGGTVRLSMIDYDDLAHLSRQLWHTIQEIEQDGQASGLYAGEDD